MHVMSNFDKILKNAYYPAKLESMPCVTFCFLITAQAPQHLLSKTDAGLSTVVNLLVFFNFIPTFLPLGIFLCIMRAYIVSHFNDRDSV